MTVVGRSKLDHPALGTVGGSSLHTSIETMWTAVSDHLGSRFKAYSSQSNSTTVTYEHNFGKELSTLQVHIYTGSAGNLTKVKDPTAAGWVIAATSGFLKTKVDVTTPSTGGPHTFVVSVHEDEKSLDNLSITGTAGQGYVDVATQSSAPSSPASGDVRIYSKTDGKLYKKDSSGNEAAVGAGTGSGGVNYLVDWYDATKAVGTVSTVAGGGNVTVSGSFPNVTSAWYADATSGAAAIASSSNNTLRGTANYLSALSGTSTSGATFVQSPVFNIDGKDLGSALTVQFDLSGVTTDDDYDVVAVRYNSSGTFQELIPIAGNVSTMTGTPSAKLPLGVKQFNGFFITGSTASDVYAIRWRRRAGSVQIRLDSLTVGPQQVLQGAIVTAWQSYTATIANFTTSSQTAYWRRVGDSMEIRFQCVVSGVGSAADAIFKIPSGYTIGTFSIANGSGIGSGYWYDSGVGFFSATPEIRDASAGEIRWQKPSVVGRLQGNQLGLNDELEATITVPISQWSSGTTTLADRAVEEYAYNTDATSTASITGSGFANGPDGFGISASWTGVGTTAYTRRVRFQTPILPTDRLTVELFDTTLAQWTPSEYLFPRNVQSTLSYGILMLGTSTVTDVDIQFANGGSTAGGATYASNGSAWSTRTGYKWRVRKVSGGAAVGYPVGARNVVGDTTGTAVPAGYIGQQVEVTKTSDTTGSTTSGTYTTILTSSNLPAGVWRFDINCPYFDIVGISGDTGSVYQGRVIKVRVLKNGATTVYETYGPGLGKSTVNSGYFITSVNGYFFEITTSGTDSYALQFTAVNNSGTPTITGTNAVAPTGSPHKLTATRIA